MPDYKTMYFQLAARVADAVELLTMAQQRGEDTYIKSEGAPIIVLEKDGVDKNKE